MSGNENDQPAEYWWGDGLAVTPRLLSRMLVSSSAGMDIGLHRRHGRVADAAALGNTSSEERDDDDYPIAFRRVSSSHLGKSGRCQQSRHLLLRSSLGENEFPTKVCIFADRLGAATCLALLGISLFLLSSRPSDQPAKQAKQP